MEASSSSTSENRFPSLKIAPRRAKVSSSEREGSWGRNCLNMAIPWVVLGQSVRISQLQIPQGVCLSRGRGLLAPHSLHMQKTFPLRMLKTVRLKGVYSIPSFPTSAREEWMMASVWMGVLPCGMKAVERKRWTNCPRDRPSRTVGGGRSQLVRKTSSPVLTLRPSHVPPDFISLPPQILGSSAKLPKGRVFLSVCSSRLKPRMNFIRGSDCGSVQKKVRHMDYNMK